MKDAFLTLAVMKDAVPRMAAGEVATTSDVRRFRALRAPKPRSESTGPHPEPSRPSADLGSAL
ncbi:hypothetical protein [Actinophytocola sp.]|uniref:hypothetical protein n=1 Tax=Actinophytocola sp. TaxID=1872138 RepID=UPI002ED240BC